MGESDQSERLAEWLDARLQDVDGELAARIRSAVGADTQASAADAPSVLLNAAVKRLAPLAADGCVARASAIDLLAVDALVTLACEALANVGADVRSIVDGAAAMIRPLAATMPELDGAA